MSLVNEINRRLADPELEPTFSRQHLVNYLWALADVDYKPSDDALRAVVNGLKTRVDLCRSQELANAVWACGQLDYYDEDFLTLFAQMSVERIDEFNGINLALLASGLSKLSFFHADVMRAIANALPEHLSTISSRYLTTICHSFTVLNVSAAEVFTEIAGEVKKRISGRSSEKLSKYVFLMLWSFAMADAMDRPLWDALIKDVQAEMRNVSSFERSESAGNTIPTEFNQIFQAWMICTARHPDTDWPLSETLMEEGRKAWKQAIQSLLSYVYLCLIDLF